MIRLLNKPDQPEIVWPFWTKGKNVKTGYYFRFWFDSNNDGEQDSGEKDLFRRMFFSPKDGWIHEVGETHEFKLETYADKIVLLAPHKFDAPDEDPPRHLL